MSWEKLKRGWKLAFDFAWTALKNETIPIGCVILDDKENLISSGSNLIYGKEKNDDKILIFGNKLAHAEINAILKIQNDPNIRKYILYSTLEPCSLCFGAIIMGNIRRVKYAAKDRWAGAASILNLDIKNIKLKEINVSNDNEILALFQIILLTYFAEKYKPINWKKHIESYRIDYNHGVEIGRNPLIKRKLDEFINNGSDVKYVYNYVEGKL